MFTPEREFPRVTSDPAGLRGLSASPCLGIDFEYDIRTGAPTILGASDGARTASVKFSEGLSEFLRLIERLPENVKLVGHNFIGAEKPILSRMGVEVPLECIEDTILRFWLTNMHLCKSEGKGSDDDDPKGRGFMNLWTMLSLYTNAANYKECVGEKRCVGEQRPCPDHSPFHYNGLDALYPIQALPGLIRHSELRGVEHLYPLHVQLADFLTEIRDRGINVDVPYVERLRREFQTEKERIWREGSTDCALAGKFNPESPKQVLSYFKSRGIELENNQEETVRKVYAETGDADLGLLLDWKELGDGPDRWFKPRTWNEKKMKWDGFVDEKGLLHPRLGTFTSSGRLQCTSPNLQNVAKRRIDRNTGEKIGRRVRRAIIPPPGHYFVRGDLKNAENLVYLYLAGHRDVPLDRDLHTWVKDLIGIRETDEFAVRLGGARDAAKSGTHATDYMEGLQLLSREQLCSPRIVNEAAAGARLVFSDWTFEGLTVSFTGVNFARRAFGDASWENRKRALDFTVRYFRAFPKLRELQKRITKQVERDRAVIAPLGYYLLSYGAPEDRMKTAAAVYGSQPVAHWTKLAMLNARDDGRVKVQLQVHDELLFAVERRIPVKVAAKWCRGYMEEVREERMPGFRLRADVTAGANWGECKEIV